MPWKRTDEEWELLRSTGYDFLIERAKLEKTTSYTEMNTTLARRTGLRPFDFDEEHDRAAMGALLGDITVIHRRDTASETMMLSALSQYLNANDAGPGFFALAVEFRQLPKNPSRQVKADFWVERVAEVIDHYR